MAHIYRLVIFFVFISPLFSYAAFPIPQGYLWAYQGNGEFPSPSAACSSSGFSLGDKVTDSLYYCKNSNNVLFGLTNRFPAPVCPSNSTKSGDKCSCESGFEEKDGQCKAPLSDLEKCAAWNKDFNSMPDSKRPTDADGFRSVEPSLVCFRPYDDPFNPVNPLKPSPGKGCVMKFERDMAFGDGNGGWTSRGKYSTVNPEVCDWNPGAGNDKPKEDKCPAGYEKSKYADVCIPLEKKDTQCPEGYEPSQYVPNVCIPKETKPDPFDPDPKNPGGPGPISPGPGGQCPDGYTNNGGSCFKTPPGDPGPVNPNPGGPGPGGPGPDPGGPGPTDPSPCPDGYEKNSTGQCVPKSGTCPEGQEKNSQGQCVPKTICEPDPKWPEKCTACEKDALNPNVCKDDPGKCVPDPAIPDKCKGSGDGEEGSFGGNCEAGFTCKGDVIQCAIAREQHIRACRLFDTKNAESELYDKEKGKEGDQTKDLKGNENVNMANRIDTSDALGGGGAGVQDLTITVWRQSVTLPFSKINGGLDALGRVLVAVSFLIALRIVGRG